MALKSNRTCAFRFTCFQMFSVWISGVRAGVADSKGQGTLGAGMTPSLDYGDSYMAVCTCQNSQLYTKNGWFLLCKLYLNKRQNYFSMLVSNRIVRYNPHKQKLSMMFKHTKESWDQNLWEPLKQLWFLSLHLGKWLKGRTESLQHASSVNCAVNVAATGHLRPPSTWKVGNQGLAVWLSGKVCASQVGSHEFHCQHRKNKAKQNVTSPN
jgi:hypothetical protein